MKSTYACLCKPKQKIELRQKVLEPEEDQVLVQIIACGICRGDIIKFTQKHDLEEPFGHEPVGQIVATGPWVKGLYKGDWVVGAAEPGFATHVLCREVNLIKVPAEIGQSGALSEPFKCVTTVVRAAAADFGDTVVVVGCGFMGLAAISALKGGYLRELVAVDTMELRLKLALELGATTVLNPAKYDVIQKVRRLTSMRGADAVIEFAGNTKAITLAANLVRKRGRLVVAGGRIPQADGEGTLDALYMGAYTTHYAPPMFSPDQYDDWRRTIEAIRHGHYPSARLLTHTFPLSQIQKAFETAVAGDSGRYIKGIIINDLT